MVTCCPQAQERLDERVADAQARAQVPGRAARRASGRLAEGVGEMCAGPRVGTWTSWTRVRAQVHMSTHVGGRARLRARALGAKWVSGWAFALKLNLQPTKTKCCDDLTHYMACPILYSIPPFVCVFVYMFYHKKNLACILRKSVWDVCFTASFRCQ